MQFFSNTSTPLFPFSANWLKTLEMFAANESLFFLLPLDLTFEPSLSTFGSSLN